MFDTVPAVGVAVLALLPGAAHTFAFERAAGAFGVGLADRLVRFLAASAAFHAVAAAGEYALYRHDVRSGALRSGSASRALVEVVALAYVFVPSVLGGIVGSEWRKGRRWVRLLTGASPAPRAWDYLFSTGPRGYVRARLKSGSWVGGFYAPRTDGRNSYAAGYPHDPDLLVARRIPIDPDSGEFPVDQSDAYDRTSLLVRWSEIELLEFTEVADDE